MRYWGLNIEIDGSFYNTEQGKRLLPTAAEKAQAKANNNPYQYEGDAEFYEITVQNMMRDIEGNAVGRILIRAISHSRNSVRIIPLTSKEQWTLKRGPCANPVGGYKPNGTSCVIWFEPWSTMWNLYGDTGLSPYQILVHEMHHALRQMRGSSFATGPVRGNPSTWLGGFPNVEELFATMIENMFLSAAKQPKRMKAVYGDVPLGNRSAASFYKQYAGSIDLWFEDLEDMGRLLQNVPGIWNPVLARWQVLNSLIDLNSVT